MGQQIIALNGKVFEETSRYRLLPTRPHFKASEFSMEKDRISKRPFTLIKTPNKWYKLTWIPHLDLYLCRKLKYIRYEEKLDIKYEWKYRKKTPKT